MILGAFWSARLALPYPSLSAWLCTPNRARSPNLCVFPHCLHCYNTISYSIAMWIPSFESPLKPLSYDILVTTRAAKMRPPEPNLSQLVTMCDRWLIACQSGQYDHILITHTCFPCYKLNTWPNDMVVGSNWSPCVWLLSYMSHLPSLSAKYVRILKFCMF